MLQTSLSNASEMNNQQSFGMTLKTISVTIHSIPNCQAKGPIEEENLKIVLHPKLGWHGYWSGQFHWFYTIPINNNIRIKLK